MTSHRPLSHTETLNRLRAEIEMPPQLRHVRLQIKPRRFWHEFWGDRNWIPLKLALLVALLVAAGLLGVIR